MSEPYLIAHKVRGEPAFDIAHQMEVGDEVWWITSTYGHRAYPYWHRPLMNTDAPPMPEDTPEHFEVSAAPKGKGKIKAGHDVLVKLGLVKPREALTRRSW